MTAELYGIDTRLSDGRVTASPGNGQHPDLNRQSAFETAFLRRHKNKYSGQEECVETRKTQDSEWFGEFVHPPGTFRSHVIYIQRLQL